MEVFHYFRGRIAPMIVLTQIILAHLIGDFFLQSKSGIAQKEFKKWRSPFLYLHATIHFALILFITWNPGLWLPALLIAAIHLAIDGMKLQLQGDDNRVTWFFGDQFLHIVTLIVVWYFLLRHAPVPAYPFADFYWFIITGAVFVTRPAVIAIGVLLFTRKKLLSESDRSLPRGTEFIGTLERLLVYIFLLIGQWAAIGLIIVAKLILRSPYLLKSRHSRISEYILIGTFTSIAIAILAGLGVIFLIGEALEFGLYL